eukprot:CAMPEP_0204216184 /NCGR_PEP_ID=MMETSP0361-20130328/77973_1 /ASSEMBLY_ACC=CAM_ASM_000343 /TAXON_ID=268821 /ORGANISM="Scrippsiella Hangoei, Strain SHTV-5" /LENGTH=46 /DNA_ID= /DNA_START= /DNA_END= /DNA_ORIENTATION=
MRKPLSECFTAQRHIGQFGFAFIACSKQLLWKAWLQAVTSSGPAPK